jgi:predicted HD superfamily hydrolase involved in NAD metabolism
MTDLQATIRQAMSDKRYQHVERVVAYAQQLADQHGVNHEQVTLAAWVHDYAKERSDADFLKAIDTYQLDADLKNWGNNVWHGVVGAELIRTELGVTDEVVLQAVREHTTGGGEHMSLVSQVLFMADYLELGRTFPGVQTARDLTADNLAAGVQYQITHTLRYLMTQQVPIHPASLVTYNYWGTRDWSKN